MELVIYLLVVVVLVLQVVILFRLSTLEIYIRNLELREDIMELKEKQGNP